MTRLKFFTVTIISAFGVLIFRWLYLFSNLNKDFKIKNLYVFDEKNNMQTHNIYSFEINNIKFIFNKNAVKNVKECLPSSKVDVDLNNFKRFNEFLSYTYTDLKNNENICSGFYLSSSEIHLINSLK